MFSACHARGPEVWAHGQISWGRDDASAPLRMEASYGRGKLPPRMEASQGSVFLVPRRMPGMQQALNTYGLNKEGTYTPCCRTSQCVDDSRSPGILPSPPWTLGNSQDSWLLSWTQPQEIKGSIPKQRRWPQSCSGAQMTQSAAPKGPAGWSQADLSLVIQ